MRAGSVTVVVPCVCMCVRSNLPPHTLESQREIVTDSSQYGNNFLKGDFSKNVSFKSYGVIYLPRAAPAS